MGPIINGVTLEGRGGSSRNWDSSWQGMEEAKKKCDTTHFGLKKIEIPN